MGNGPHRHHHRAMEFRSQPSEEPLLPGIPDRVARDVRLQPDVVTQPGADDGELDIGRAPRSGERATHDEP